MSLDRPFSAGQLPLCKMELMAPTSAFFRADKR
jgi:hypothetical protein